MTIGSIVDTLIEAPIVSSFTRIGYEARRRADGRRSLDEYDLAGRVILLTGATHEPVEARGIYNERQGGSRSAAPVSLLGCPDTARTRSQDISRG